MYVITFYSYKGGVGRTLAMVNTGVELAKRGRRVLLVDFDLEAPGLDTFELLKNKSKHRGVVDYFSDFLTNGESPDVNEYLYEVPKFKGLTGNLWVMPAGHRDEQYPCRLQTLDWMKMYELHNGYLALEDLKAQWNEVLKPDYVLIDSRTGHTDVAGICTRQLPDAVVCLFFPNEQNLAGLSTVVSEIRDEANEPRNKNIELYFAMSNVPDLDDEEHILANRQSCFKRTLGYDELAGIIHRYDSLHLLNQSVFVINRPHSRLTREYVHLLKNIIHKNLADRLVALDVLHNESRWYAQRKGEAKTSSEIRNEIREKHSKDGEVLYSLAMHCKFHGKSDEALPLFDLAKRSGYVTPDLCIEQAELFLLKNERDSALTSLLPSFDLSGWNTNNLPRLIDILRLIAPLKLRELPNIVKHADNLSSSHVVVECLNRNQQELEIALEISQTHKCEDDISLILIGLGKFNEAMATISAEAPVAFEMGVASAFNYGMAVWGATGDILLSYFERVVQCDAKKKFNTPNNQQCVALSLFLTGHKEKALNRLNELEESIGKGGLFFTCWRYLSVSEKEFRLDCQEMRRFFNGESLIPLVFNKENNLSDKSSPI